MSGARSRRKGREWENKVVNWLRDHGHPHVERNEYLRAPEGDILGFPGWSMECKNHGVLDLAGWVDQARDQAETAGAKHFAVIVKRKGRGSPGDAYVVMDLETWAKWMGE